MSQYNQRGPRMDYHLHSFHSMDGRQTINTICEEAIKQGLSEICLTEHIEPHHPTPDTDIPPVFPEWFADIQSAREKHNITIRAGIEIGDNRPYREEIWDTLNKLPLDYRLLSLHLINNMDPYDQIYFEGKTQEEAYRLYAKARVESILNFKDYDGIAHLGYVGKFAPYDPEIRPFRYHHAPDELDVILKYLAQEGKALEINASGLRATDSPIPGGDIIKRYIQLGGEFLTFGSDAHYQEHIYQHVETAKEIARANGAKWQVGFDQRKKIVYPI